MPKQIEQIISDRLIFDEKNEEEAKKPKTDKEQVEEKEINDFLDKLPIKI